MVLLLMFGVSITYITVGVFFVYTICLLIVYVLLINYLLERGKKNKQCLIYVGDTPLHIATRCGRAEVIKALSTSLSKAEVYHPYFRVPYKSLPQDNVQSYNHDGRMPIHLATQTANSVNHQEAVQALVRYSRADIDYRVCVEFCMCNKCDWVFCSLCC